MLANETITVLASFGDEAALEACIEIAALQESLPGREVRVYWHQETDSFEAFPVKTSTRVS
jgi:hypothetical protein